MGWRSESLRDTIVARATGAPGAIAILRLSGPAAHAITDRLAGAAAREPRRLTRRRLRDPAGAPLDEALVVEMPGPDSFTGEDVVELHLHGSPAVVAATERACLTLGARPAGPGEFSLRALLHGRLDLTQAEALADLIASRSEEQRLAALANLEGRLSHAVGELLEPLEGLLAAWLACLDFPEQVDLEPPRPAELVQIEDCGCKIQQIMDSSRLELTRGFRVVLCGPTNAGKSSLLNRLVGEERVLVDAEPGTTRDPVEVELSDHGQTWIVCDTAGLRDSPTDLEGRGMQLSRVWMRRAELALWLVAPDAVAWPTPAPNLLLAGSKADLADSATRQALEAEASRRNLSFAGWCSSVTCEGLPELRARLFAPARATADVALVVRERQLDALERAHVALSESRAAGLTLDVRAQLLGEATRALGELLGREVDDEVLERIFANFCVGK